MYVNVCKCMQMYANVNGIYAKCRKALERLEKVDENIILIKLFSKVKVRIPTRN